MQSCGVLRPKGGQDLDPGLGSQGGKRKETLSALSGVWASRSFLWCSGWRADGGGSSAGVLETFGGLCPGEQEGR